MFNDNVNSGDGEKNYLKEVFFSLTHAACDAGEWIDKRQKKMLERRTLNSLERFKGSRLFLSTAHSTHQYIETGFFPFHPRRILRRNLPPYRISVVKSKKRKLRRAKKRSFCPVQMCAFSPTCPWWNALIIKYLCSISFHRMCSCVVNRIGIR